jgi:hypothetical protein
MNASEMARRRWVGVSEEERSRLASSAARARWASATEEDRLAAQSRAAKAREVRTRIIAARFLGVDPSELENIAVQLVSSSDFRRQKRTEQEQYWNDLRQRQLRHSVYADPVRARNAMIVRP